MSAFFLPVLRAFQSGAMSPAQWLRELEETPGLLDWVKARISRERPLPDQFWTPPKHLQRKQ